MLRPVMHAPNHAQDVAVIDCRCSLHASYQDSCTVHLEALSHVARSRAATCLHDSPACLTLVSLLSFLLHCLSTTAAVLPVCNTYVYVVNTLK